MTAAWPAAPERGARHAAAWNIVRARIDAQSAHDLDLTRARSREVRVFEIVRPALVLGSAQSERAVDTHGARARGYDVARRRSGGGAVVLEGHRSVWADLVIPRDDPLWHDDIGRSMHWVGQLWVDVLASIGVDARVHRGPLERSAVAPALCFASLGPGEVTAAGAKVVGISQRRTRAAARFQTLALVRADDEAVPEFAELDLVAVADRAAARELLAAQRAAAPAAPAQAVQAALVAALRA